MTLEEFQRRIHGLRAAQARVAGILRGGFFDPIEGLFYYSGRGCHCESIDAIREFSYTPKRKRLKQ